MSSTKYFYRLEHATTCEGPYRHSGASFVDPNPDPNSIYMDNVVRYIMRETGEDFSSENPNCPSPFVDKEKGEVLSEKVLPNEQINAIFGFRSIVQARKWWGQNPKVYRLFKKSNFILRRYKASERFDGGRQSVAFSDKISDPKEIPFEKVLTSGKRTSKVSPC